MTKEPSIEKQSYPDDIILVAEDDDISYALIEILLSKLNKKIIRAKTGNEVIKLFEQNSQISLILMDLKMPVMDGYDATHEIRKIDNKVPIIAQSAYALSGDKQKALDAGCNDYISKPINKEDFLEKIENYLQHT